MGNKEQGKLKEGVKQEGKKERQKGGFGQKEMKSKQKEAH